MFFRPQHYTLRSRRQSSLYGFLSLFVVIGFGLWLSTASSASYHHQQHEVHHDSSSLHAVPPNILLVADSHIVSVVNDFTPAALEDLAASSTTIMSDHNNEEDSTLTIMEPQTPPENDNEAEPIPIDTTSLDDDVHPNSNNQDIAATPPPQDKHAEIPINHKPIETRWHEAYSTPECRTYRQSPVGRASAGEVGLGRRSLCLDRNYTLEMKKEIEGSVDISISHRAIYIPVMKAGTQMFAEVFKRRFGGVRIRDRDLTAFMKRHGARLGEFFVFSFVRNPFSMFRSAYGEASLYAAHSKIAHAGFALLPQTLDNEPERAIQALDDVRHGRFSGLVPAHLFTQVWKTQRCIHHQDGKGMIPLELDFIGHLENVAEDWRFVERNLMVPHVPLPVIHSSDTAKERVAAKEMLKFVSVTEVTSKFARLTRQVCDYYRNDFVCFGYVKEMASCH